MNKKTEAAGAASVFLNRPVKHSRAFSLCTLSSAHTKYQ